MKKVMFRAPLLCLGLTLSTFLFAQRGLNLNLDFSGSCTPQGYINEPTIQKVHSLLSAHFQNDGDFVVLSYLFGNSAAVNNAKVYTMKIPTLEAAFRDSDSKLQTVSNRGLQTRVKKSLIDKIVSDIKAVKAPAAQKSEILEGLIHVKRSVNASSLHVVFFSDMIENSSIRRFINALDNERCGKLVA